MTYDYNRRVAKSERLDQQTRAKVNADLDHAGFGGRRKFKKVGEALNVAFDVLAKYGIEQDETLNAHDYRLPKGQRLIHLALTNQEDSFSPTSISNLGLSFSWEDLGGERFEVIAYLS